MLKKANTEKGVLSGMVNSIETPSVAGSADGLVLAEKTVLSDVVALSSLSDNFATISAWTCYTYQINLGYTFSFSFRNL